MVLRNPMAKSGGRTVGRRLENSGSTAMRKAGVPREVCDSDRNVLPIRTVHLVFDSERTVHHATGDPFVSWTLRCAKRENQDLSVLVTRGARARGARARGARARRARARGARSEVRSPRPRRERPVTARGLCHTRSGQTIYSTQHSYLFIMRDAQISYVCDLLSHTEHIFQKF